jgi:hypothetical protein
VLGNLGSHHPDPDGCGEATKFDVEERWKPGLEAGFNAVFLEILHQFNAGYSIFLALNRNER